MVRVEGVASIWMFDDALGMYMRMPRAEAPRERPEWGDARAGACQDWVWHELDQWWVTDDGDRLIVVPRRWGAFWAPLTPAGDTATFDLEGELRHGRNRGDADG